MNAIDGSIKHQSPIILWLARDSWYAGPVPQQSVKTDASQGWQCSQQWSSRMIIGNHVIFLMCSLNGDDWCPIMHMCLRIGSSSNKSLQVCNFFKVLFIRSRLMRSEKLWFQWMVIAMDKVRKKYWLCKGKSSYLILKNINHNDHTLCNLTPHMVLCPRTMYWTDSLILQRKRQGSFFWDLF